MLSVTRSMDGYRRGRRTGPDVTLGRGLFSKFSNELFAHMNKGVFLHSLCCCCVIHRCFQWKGESCANGCGAVEEVEWQGHGRKVGAEYQAQKVSLRNGEITTRLYCSIISYQVCLYVMTLKRKLQRRGENDNVGERESFVGKEEEGLLVRRIFPGWPTLTNS